MIRLRQRHQPKPVQYLTGKDFRPPWHRRWPVQCAVAALLVGGGAWLVLPQDRPALSTAPVRRDRAQPPPHLDALLAVLDERQRRLLPRDRERFDAALLDRTATLQPALLWLLADPSHPRFEAAADLAACLHIADAAPLLAEVDARQRPSVRRAALQALDRLQPLGEADLLAALADELPLVQCTALTILQARPARSLLLQKSVVQLLTHPAEAVRRAAFAALPARPPTELEADLRALAGDAVAGPLATQALLRFATEPDSAQAVGAQLLAAEPAAQLLLLQQLAARPYDAVLTEPLWRLALGAGDEIVRAAALHCLEPTADCSRLPHTLLDWPPALRFAAARLLLAAGEHRGLLLLLDLSGDSDLRAAGQSRLLLSRLSGLPPHSTADEFAAWARRQQAAPPLDVLPTAAPGR